MWDVLSNKEAVDIVASAPGHGTAARALVDCATRAWRLKYPTSKNDDCAVVCLFLEHTAMTNELKSQNDAAIVPEEETKIPQDEKKVPVEETKVPQDEKKLPEEETKVLQYEKTVPEEETKMVPEEEMAKPSSELESETQNIDTIASHTGLGTTKEASEIVPVVEEVEEKTIDTTLGQSKRSLAECLSTAEDEEWSALEGITRVNSLLSLPRFLPFDRRSTSWRKWL